MDDRYFKVERAETPAVHRERAYCYELYHRLRCTLPSTFPYTLHGEIDKSGSKTAELLGKGLNPDFIVHRPGKQYPQSNLAVIEVKTWLAAQSTAMDVAVDHVRQFLSKVDYRVGIILIFGDENSSRPPAPRDAESGLKERIHKMSLTREDRIIVIWHRTGEDTSFDGFQMTVRRVLDERFPHSGVHCVFRQRGMGKSRAGS